MQKVVRGFRSKLDQFVDVSRPLELKFNVAGASSYDFSCFCLNADKKLGDPDNMVFYNHLASDDGSVVLKLDFCQAAFTVDLTKVPAAVENMSFVLTIDGVGSMGNVSFCSVCICQNGSGLLGIDYNPSDFLAETALITLEIYRKGGVWRTAFTGQGFYGGLPDMLKYYGGEQDENDYLPDAPAPAVNTAPSKPAAIPAPLTPAAPAQTALSAVKTIPVISAAPEQPVPQAQSAADTLPLVPVPPEAVQPVPVRPAPAAPIISITPSGTAPAAPVFGNKAIRQTAVKIPVSANPQLMLHPERTLGSRSRTISLRRTAVRPNPEKLYINLPRHNKRAGDICDLSGSLAKAHLSDLYNPLDMAIKRWNVRDFSIKTALVMDCSGSMLNRYDDGTVQNIIDKVVPLAVQFDDDGSLDFWYFGDKSKRQPSVTAQNYRSAVPRDWESMMEELGYENNEPVVMREVLAEYWGNSAPSCVLFITDGSITANNEIAELLRRSSFMPVFWQFIGVGGNSYGILEHLDTIERMNLLNADFLAIEDFKSFSVSDLYDHILKSLSSWIDASAEKK